MESLLLRPEELASLLGIGRTKAYELIATKRDSTVRIGRAVRIPRSAVVKWIEQEVGGDAGRIDSGETADQPAADAGRRDPSGAEP